MAPQPSTLPNPTPQLLKGGDIQAFAGINKKALETFIK